MKPRPLAPLLLALVPAVPAADGGLKSVQLVDDTTGLMAGVLLDGDFFGQSIDWIGDLDGDGVSELVVGAPEYTHPDEEGSLWIVFPNADGTVKKREKIDGTTTNANLGVQVTAVGDVDGDGVSEVASASILGNGAFLYFLNADGTLKSSVHYTQPATPIFSAQFGASVCGPGDIDGDGTPDLIITEKPISATDPDVLHVSLLNPDGTIKQETAVGQGLGGFLGQVPDAGWGWRVCGLGDVNGDGVPDVFVTAPFDDDGGTSVGSGWVLMLNADGTVGHEVKLSKTTGGLGDAVGDSSFFGIDVPTARLDLDGNGVRDILIPHQGNEALMLFLESDGTIRSTLDLRVTDFGQPEWEDFGDVVAVPDMDGDGAPELIAGLPSIDGAGSNRGGFAVGFFEGVTGAGFSAIGCGQNPAGSLQLTAQPILGDTVTFELDNPLGTQNPGAFPFLAVSLQSPAAGGGCGIPLPGFHMNPAQPTGEMLVQLPLALPELMGAPWMPGQPSEVQLPIPDASELLGVTLYVQGLLFDPTGGPGGTQQFGLTRGVAIEIGV